MMVIRCQCPTCHAPVPLTYPSVQARFIQKRKRAIRSPTHWTHAAGCWCHVTQRKGSAAENGGAGAGWRGRSGGAWLRIELQSLPGRVPSSTHHGFGWVQVLAQLQVSLLAQSEVDDSFGRPQSFGSDHWMNLLMPRWADGDVHTSFWDAVLLFRKENGQVAEEQCSREFRQ